MNINELLVTDKSKQRPPDLVSDDKENRVRLSDFLQYPTLDDSEPESDTDDVELRELIGPSLKPIAAEIVARLVEATGRLEVLEILHDAYGMYCDGDFLLDMDARDEWPDFWEEVLGSDGSNAGTDIA